MLEILIVAALVVLLPALILGAVSFIREQVSFEALLPRGLEKVWYLPALFLALLILMFVLNSGPGPRGEFNVFVVVILVALGAFAFAWQRQFLFLMSLRDEDFPGRLDKAIWAFVLIALAPISFWMFRSYRLAHWPEPKPESIRGSAAADLS